MSIDVSRHDGIARQVGETLRTLVGGLVKELDGALAEHDERVRAAHDTHKREEEERGRSRMTELQQTLIEQGGKIRDDVQRIARERADALEHSIQAVQSGVRASIDEALTKARSEVTEEVAAAVRSIHDDLGVRLEAVERKVK